MPRGPKLDAVLRSYSRAVVIDRALRAANEPLTRSRLAELTGVDKRTISRTLDWMREELEVTWLVALSGRGYRYRDGAPPLPALEIRLGEVAVRVAPADATAPRRTLRRRTSRPRAAD